MDFRFRPKKTSRSGMQLVTTCAALGTLTANATTTFYIPTPRRRCVPVRVSYQCSTVAADADGTILGTLSKRDVSAGANVTLSPGTFSLEGVTAETATEVPLTSTLTDAQRTFAEGDTLKLAVVNNSAAIDTQHANASVTVEWAVLE